VEALGLEEKHGRSEEGESTDAVMRVVRCTIDACAIDGRKRSTLRRPPKGDGGGKAMCDPKL